MENNRICPVERSGSLDTTFRKWLQDSQKILHPYVKEGMTAVDFGCGPGFFTVDMAHMVGESGRVIAVDLQEGMLQKLREKIQGTEHEERIMLHKCEEDNIGIAEQVDFILAFYVVHEVPRQDMFQGDSIHPPKKRVDVGGRIAISCFCKGIPARGGKSSGSRVNSL